MGIWFCGVTPMPDLEMEVDIDSTMVNPVIEILLSWSHMLLDWKYIA